MLPKRNNINRPLLSDAHTLSQILQKVQDECYRLLPTKIKQKVAPGNTLKLTQARLGFKPGYFPYANRKDLLKNEAKYGQIAACLLYESFLLINRSNIANIQFDHDSDLTFAAAVSYHVGFENARDIKKFFFSLAEDKKFIPLAVNETTYQLAELLKEALEKIVRNNLLPITNEAVKQKVEIAFSRMISELNRTIFEYQSTIEPQKAEPLPEVSFHIEAPAGEENAVEEKNQLQFEMLPNYTQAPENPVKSDLFNKILHDMLDNSWSTRAVNMMKKAKLFALGINMVAFTNSLSVHFQKAGRADYNAEDVLPVYMALLPNDVIVLERLSVKLQQVSDCFERGSQYQYEQTLILAAVTAKLEMFKHPEVKPQDQFDREQLQLNMPAIEAEYVYHQHLLYLTPSAEAYYEQLLTKISEKLSVFDPSDSYYNVIDEMVYVNEDTKEEQKYSRSVDFVEAFMREFHSKDPNKRIMQFAEKDVTFRQLLEKFDVMTNLVNDLKNRGKSPRNRVLQFHKDLRDNLPVLNQNRDSGVVTFLKVVGFVLSTFLIPVIGNYLFYSQFFVSKGCRYSSQAMRTATPMVNQINATRPNVN